MFCENCGKKINKYAAVCPECGRLINTHTRQSNTVLSEYEYSFIKPSIRGMSMSWYCFMIWGYLILVFIFEVIAGIIGFVGFIDAIYILLRIPSLIIIRFLYMIFPVTMAVWITIVRRRFIMFKKNALKSFIVWHIVFSVGNCLLVIIRETSTILPVQNFWLEFLILILDASFMISFNYVYFKKRSFLFYK